MNQTPGQLLIIYKGSPFQGVRKVLFQRIVLIQHHIETALNHAATSALANQAFRGQNDFDVRIAIVKMQSGK